ncbi:hypothetical protein [Pacificispira sp.]|uniref:hypothetical protein n=1 Tax=Pacificispira sp. TaxID=2888761 RepID=UPI003BA89873
MRRRETAHPVWQSIIAGAAERDAPAPDGSDDTDRGIRAIHLGDETGCVIDHLVAFRSIDREMASRAGFRETNEILQTISQQKLCFRTHNALNFLFDTLAGPNDRQIGVAGAARQPPHPVNPQ